MFTTNSPIVKPEVVLSDELFDEIKSGKLRIPRFQRPFVWNPTDMLDLFDSIYKGYPIGSLLLWETTENIEGFENIESFNKIGPLEMPEPESSTRTYILDGQQRLATLYCALSIPKDHPIGKKQENWKWWIWFDLKTKEFIHVKNGHPDPWLLPLRSISKTVDFLAEARRLQEDDACKANAAEFIDEAERLSDKIKSYKMAIIRIKGGDLDQAVEIFSRLNTQGRRITPDQMVSALTYRNIDGKKSLTKKIDEILERLNEYHFGNISRMTVFRAILASNNKDIHKSEWGKIAKNLNKYELEKAIDKASTALMDAARFISEELGTPGDKLLPYTNQILILGDFFHYCPQPGESQKAILKKWFWVSSLSGGFASQNNTQLNKALKEMRAFAVSGDAKFHVMSLDLPSRPFPIRYDTRAARVRALLIFMFSLGPLDPETAKPIAADKILGEAGNKSPVYVFPGVKAPLASSPANRILLEKRPGKTIRERLRSIPREHLEKVLRGHGIPDSAYEGLLNDDARKFIEEREQHMARIERRFMQKVGVAPPKENTFGEPDIDTD